MKFESTHSYESSAEQPDDTRGGLLHQHEALVHTAKKDAETKREPERDWLESFIGAYTREKVNELVQEAKGKEKKFEKNDPLIKDASDATEIMLWEILGIYDWFTAAGIKLFVEKTTFVDDILNHTDLVLTFETEEGKSVVIAVDVTIGGMKIGQKIHDHMVRVKQGKQTDLFFHETPNHVKGPLTQVPGVALYVENEKLIQLFRDWTDKDKDTRKGSRERIKTHPIQLELVQQVEAQLRVYEKYAREEGNKKTADSLLEALEVIQRILAEKEELFKTEKNTEASARRAVFWHLDRELKKIEDARKLLQESPDRPKRGTKVPPRLRD